MFESFEGVICHADDVLVYGQNREEHDQRLQKQEDNSWQPVTYLSRGLTDTEKRYAQIEKEALAATWLCERLTSYLQGLHFTLQTYHKPLVPLLSTRGLDDLPPGVLRFRLRLLRYDYDIVQVPGKKRITAMVQSSTL